MSTNRISKNTPQEAKEINEWDDIEGSEESEIIHGYNNKLIGNSGSDELIGLSRFTSVGYRNSPEGVVVNLVDNVISDGWGFEDKIIDIDTIWDSKFDDNITGNEKNQTFWIDLGNDTVNGGNVTNGTKGTDLTFAEFAEVFGVYDILNSSGAQTGTISDLYII